MFEKEAHHLLLFLNNINKIEVYEKESAKTKPKLLMSVSVATPEALHTRVQFKKSVEPFARHRLWMPSPLAETYKMTTKFSKQERPPKVKVSNKQWLVTQYYDGGDSPAKKFLNEKGSKYLPWMGVALQLAEGARCCVKKSGQIFCFLPLPKQEESLTSFNFHVNGFFSVSQDRYACVTLEHSRIFLSNHVIALKQTEPQVAVVDAQWRSRRESRLEQSACHSSSSASSNSHDCRCNVTLDQPQTHPPPLPRETEWRMAGDDETFLRANRYSQHLVF